tara:strand:- start:255 stop:1037 length:783 start_codon:yes stop_codon:yes gene_type:complete
MVRLDGQERLTIFSIKEIRMAQRMIRAEILESDRFLELPSCREKMAFMALLLKADDYGNFEATDGALHRLWRDHDVETVKEALLVLGHLINVDLVQSYEVGGKRFLHIPRFQQKLRSYKSRVPLPPWQENEIKQTDSKKSGRKLQKTLLEEEVEVEVQEEEVNNNNNIVKLLGKGEVVETLPIKGGSCKVCKSWVMEIEPCYPNVDIIKTLREVKGWLISDKQNLKTSSGIGKCLNHWFRNEQAKAYKMLAKQGGVKDGV